MDLQAPTFSAGAADALRRLIAELLAGTRDRASFRQGLAELVRERLACSSVTTWAVEASGAGWHFERAALACASAGLEAPAARIAQHETTALWCALQRDGVLPWIDVAADVSFLAAQARRFAPAPARAVLLGAVTLNARPFALICACEHAGPRDWGCAEQTWLKRTAAQVVAALNRLQQVAPPGQGSD